MDAAEVRILIQQVAQLHKFVGSMLDRSGDRPHPGSQGERELLSFQRPASLETAFAQTTLLIEASGDHLISYTRAMTEPVLTIASWATVRSIFEASSIAAWLLEGAIDATERAMRSYALRLKGMQEQVKFARASHLEAEVTMATDRIAIIERDANLLGFPSHHDKKGRLTSIGQEMPSATDLSRDVLKDEPTYRLLSAVLHGHSWALQQAGFERVPRTTGPFLQKNIQPLAILFLTERAVRAFIRPVRDKAHLFGWDSAACVAHSDGIIDRIGALFLDSQYPLSASQEQSA